MLFQPVHIHGHIDQHVLPDQQSCHGNRHAFVQFVGLILTLDGSYRQQPRMFVQTAIDQCTHTLGQDLTPSPMPRRAQAGTGEVWNENKHTGADLLVICVWPGRGVGELQNLMDTAH
jgi:hypothetical protein